MKKTLLEGDSVSDFNLDGYQHQDTSLSAPMTQQNGSQPNQTLGNKNAHVFSITPLPSVFFVYNFLARS